MNIVVAGGTGFLGSAIVRKLLEQHHEVTLLSRSAADAPWNVRLDRWDGRTVGDWLKSIEDADAIINLAGASIGGGRWTKKRKELIRDSRVQSTSAIVEGLRRVKRKPRVLVNASGVDYYGHVPEHRVDEASPAGTDFLSQVCSDWEAAAQGAAESGARVVMMRTSFVIGEGSEAFRRMVLPFKLFAGGPYGSGSQWFSWIHLNDVVAGYLIAVQNPAFQGAVNLTSPNPVRVNDLAKTLGKVLDRPSVLPAPAFALRVVLGEMADLLLKGRRALPEKLKKAGFMFRFPNLEDALRAATGQ